eukprot:TRINITY_DN1649_c0_g1_i1.p1 TRINITY_DN1649_c0_g1~~TRINITY_DN1649_c0_g1_i1.p1  ORF type:complete len:112 (+),score=5.13 TRINITY_DN1649_c0_g1_i1:145-480(+)
MILTTPFPVVTNEVAATVESGVPDLLNLWKITLVCILLLLWLMQILLMSIVKILLVLSSILLLLLFHSIHSSGSQCDSATLVFMVFYLSTVANSKRNSTLSSSATLPCYWI